MDPLPRPPAEFDVDAAFDDEYVRPVRAGELSGPWRIVYGIAWIGVILGLAAVWRSSRTLGLPVWWLGPEAGPRPLPVQLLPFVAPVLLALGAIRSVRHLPWLGGIGAGWVIAIGAVDLADYAGLAAVQIALGVAGGLVSAASAAGVLTYREPTDPTDPR